MSGPNSDSSTEALIPQEAIYLSLAEGTNGYPWYLSAYHPHASLQAPSVSQVLVTHFNILALPHHTLSLKFPNSETSLPQPHLLIPFYFYYFSFMSALLAHFLFFSHTSPLTKLSLLAKFYLLFSFSSLYSSRCLWLYPPPHIYNRNFLSTILWNGHVVSLYIQQNCTHTVYIHRHKILSHK